MCMSMPSQRLASYSHPTAVPVENGHVAAIGRQVKIRHNTITLACPYALAAFGEMHVTSQLRLKHRYVYQRLTEMKGEKWPLLRKSTKDRLFSLDPITQASTPAGACPCRTLVRRAFLSFESFHSSSHLSSPTLTTSSTNAYECHPRGGGEIQMKWFHNVFSNIKRSI